MMRDVAFEAVAASASASSSSAAASSVGSGVDLMPLAMGRYVRLTVVPAPSRPGKEGTDLEDESSPRELDPLVRVRVRVRVWVRVWVRVRVRVRVRQPQGARSPEIEARRQRG